jgi:hypothetical protein
MATTDEGIKTAGSRTTTATDVMSTADNNMETIGSQTRTVANRT